MFSNTSAQRKDAPKKPSSAEIARNLNVGIVLHDNSNRLAEGWACIHGKEPQRVRGLFDLPNDTLWISNGDFQDFKKLGGTQFHHVRRTGYLGLKLAELARDLGIRIDGGHAKEGGEKLAYFVQGAVRLAVEIYNLDNPLKQLQEDTLVATIGKVLPSVTPSPENLSQIFSSAYQAWSSKYVGFMDDTANVRLRFNRVAYADFILSQKVPDTGWSRIYSGDGFNHDLVKEGKFVPTLIEAVVEFDSMDADTAMLVAYGVGPGSVNQRSKRAWMTDVEYRWISDFARVHVQSYFMAVDFIELPSACRLPERLYDDSTQLLGVNTGLVASMHWQSLASAKYSRLTSRSEYDVYSTWLRAHDRAMCFQAAYVLQQKGFAVNGYGSGSVMVSCPRSRFEDLLQAAEDLDMAYPIRDGLVKEFGYATYGT